MKSLKQCHASNGTLKLIIHQISTWLYNSVGLHFFFFNSAETQKNIQKKFCKICKRYVTISFTYLKRRTDWELCCFSRIFSLKNPASYLGRFWKKSVSAVWFFQTWINPSNSPSLSLLFHYLKTGNSKKGISPLFWKLMSSSNVQLCTSQGSILTVAISCLKV